MLSANRVRWKVGGVWWFTWTDEGGTCIFCSSAGLLTSSLRSEALLVPIHRMDGRQPDTVPRARLDESERSVDRLRGTS